MGLCNYLSTGLLLAVCWLVVQRCGTNQRLPPGPKPIPLIGNLFDMPQKRLWATLAQWKDQYGDIVYLKVFGKSFVILNSRKVCVDLLERRSKKYSDRPRFVMLSELIGWNFSFGSMRYSSRWRMHRRVFHQYFNKAGARNFCAIQKERTRAFLRNLLSKPENLRDHTRLLFSEMILKTVYGYQVEGLEDDFVELNAEIIRMFSVVAQPGKFIVETLPFLKAVPSWFPGAGFKKQAARWREYALAVRNKPAALVQQQMENGTAQPSILVSAMSKHGEEKPNIGESWVEVAKNICASAYAAGADTTLSAFEAFFLAMANHPECQRAAQVEIDTVLGGSRLPTFEDRQDLPYINAIVKEVLRWHTIAPSGVPHTLTEDDEYNGYFLPKGSMILPNIRGLLYDPETYPDPHVFNPSRWLIDTPEGKKLNESIPAPDTVAFGFGRRVCPGRYFADNSLFIGIASVLATFTIHPLDADGAPADRCVEGLTDGFIVWPSPYNVSIKPRSDLACLLINETE